MALQSDVNLSGFTFQGCYIRLVRFIFTGKTSCRAYIEVYPSEEVAQEGTPMESYLQPVDFKYDYESDLSLHAQAYEAAKLMPEFADAIDV